MSYCDEDYLIGDLVCLKSHYGGSHGWLAIDLDVGVILEVIELEATFVFYDKKFRCYDFVIYWTLTGQTETIPDILVEKYDEFLRRLDEIK